MEEHNEEQKLTKKERLQQQREEKAAKKESAAKQAATKRNVIAAVIAVIVIAAIWLLSSSGSTTTDIVDRSPDPSSGPEDAPVLVEAYEDFQCPACAGTAPVVKDILERYGNQVRFEYNDFPLPQHEYAVTAAIAGECAFEQDLFFPFHDIVFARQSSWAALGSEREVEDTLLDYANEVGIDADQFLTCTADNATADKVDEDLVEARTIGVNSTPSFYVNGERIGTGAVSVALPEAIDEALAQ